MKSEWSQKVKNVFLENQKEEVIKTIHTKVKDGIYGADYTIAPRVKNKKLRDCYNVNDEKIKEILLSLSIEDFISQDMSNNTEHVEDVVCKFMKTYPLMPKWKENANYENVSLYIKMVQPQYGQPIFIISFHEAEL